MKIEGMFTKDIKCIYTHTNQNNTVHEYIQTFLSYTCKYYYTLIYSIQPFK